MSSVKGKIIEWVIVVKEIPISTRNRTRTQIGYGSSRLRDGSAETNRGRTLNHWQKQNTADTIRGRLLIEGGNYSRKYGNSVLKFIFVVVRDQEETESSD